MRVGELSKATNVPCRALRRLALLGLIPAKRLSIKNGHWRFAQADLGRIREILTDAGLIEEGDDKQNGRTKKSAA